MYHTFPVMLSRTHRAFLKFFLVIQGWPFPLSESKYSVIPAILSGLVTAKPKLWLTAGHPYNLIYGFTHTHKQNSWPPLSSPSPSAFSRPNSNCLSGEGFPILLPSASPGPPGLPSPTPGHVFTFQNQTAVVTASPGACTCMPLCTRMVSLTFRTTQEPFEFPQIPQPHIQITAHPGSNLSHSSPTLGSN